MSSVSLTKSQVPQFLVGSEFYNSLSSEADEEFSIPSMHMKMTPDIHTPSDLAHYLRTIQFWGFRKFPNDFIAFLKRGVKPDFLEPMCDILREFEDTLHSEQLFRDLQEASSPKMLLEAAAKCVRKDVLEYLVCSGKSVTVGMAKSAAEYGLPDVLERTTAELRAAGKDPFTLISLWKVACGGHSECLRFLWQNGLQKDGGICQGAAENGHLDCLITARSLGCQWNYGTPEKAALNGHAQCLEYALREGCEVRAVDAACNAATGGHVDCLGLMFAHMGEARRISKRVANAAAASGQMNSMVCVHEHGCPWDFQCARMAAQHGHLDIVKYVVQEGCPLNCHVPDAAAAAGHLDILRFVLHDCGVMASGEGVDAAAKHEHMDCLKMLCEANAPLSAELLEKAISGHNEDSFVATVANFVNAGLPLPDGVADVVQTRISGDIGTSYVRRLVEVGYSLPEEVALMAVSKNNKPCLEYLCAQHVCLLNANLMTQALFCKNVQILEILHRHHCPSNANVCSEAAGSANLACLKFLHERGYPWDEHTCSSAARNNRADLLKYAHEHGCPWDEQTCIVAVANDRRDVLAYAHSRGCPCNIVTMNSAVERRSDKCFDYLLAQGSPRDETTTAAAAEVYTYWGDDKHQSVLKRLHEAGCPWDARTTAAAANSGNMDKLKYAHEHGCSWDESACRAAAAAGHVACLQFLHEHGCPWDASVSRATQLGPVLRYCVENGCPIDESVMKEYNENFNDK